jgi:hypothetical protein
VKLPSTRNLWCILARVDPLSATPTQRMSRLVEAVFGPDNPDDRKKRDARKKHFATMFLTAGEATWKEERARFYDDEKKKRARFKSAQGGKKAATKNRAKADADWRDGAKQLDQGDRGRMQSALVCQRSRRQSLEQVARRQAPDRRNHQKDDRQNAGAKKIVGHIATTWPTNQADRM